MVSDTAVGINRLSWKLILCAVSAVQFPVVIVGPPTCDMYIYVRSCYVSENNG